VFLNDLFGFFLDWVTHVAGFWLLVSGFWLLVAGCWLLAAGCWLLAAGLQEL
jgi:hypothetical protein